MTPSPLSRSGPRLSFLQRFVLRRRLTPLLGGPRPIAIRDIETPTVPSETEAAEPLIVWSYPRPAAG